MKLFASQILLAAVIVLLLGEVSTVAPVKRKADCRQSNVRVNRAGFVGAIFR
jgi:hypothetical protein